MTLYRPSWVRAFPFFLVLYEFAVNSSNDMYLPALLEIAQEFSVGENQVRWTITAWLIGAAFVQLILGPLSDRTGRRFVLLNGGFLFLLASIGCLFVHSISSFMLLRFIQGVGMCTLTAAGYAAIHELYEEKKAIEVLAWVAAVSILAPMLGPFLGGLVLLRSDWRTIFLCIFCLALVGWGGLILSMPETNTRPDPQALHWRKLSQSYKRILSTQGFLLAVLSDGFLFGSVMGWITASPFLLMEQFQLTRFEFGLVQVPIFAAYGLGAALIGKLMNRVGLEKAIWVGLWIAITGAFLLLFTSPLQSLHFGMKMIFPMSLFSFGFGLVSAPLTRKALFATPEKLGVSTAMLDLGIVGSGALGSGLISLLFNDTLPPVAFVIAGLTLCALGFNSLRVGGLEKKEGPEH